MLDFFLSVCVCVQACISICKFVSAEDLNPSLSLSLPHSLSVSLSLCLSLLILPLWETKLFLKKSLCLFERGEEGEAGQQNEMERILAACAGLGWGPFARYPGPSSVYLQKHFLSSCLFSRISTVFIDISWISVRNEALGMCCSTVLTRLWACCHALDVIFWSTDKHL